jgi:Fe-coproporphyrin III synthase
MLRITELLRAPVESPETGRGQAHGMRSLPGSERPVVIWNLTRRCNLHCLHCYSQSKDQAYPDELTTDEGKRALVNLAPYGVPVLILSGGDPLFREDIFELAEHAASLGLRSALSTNGTLIDASVAKRLKRSGISYVGVSLDGIGEVHDRFRGMRGSFAMALEGLRRCRDEGMKTGMRTVLCRRTLGDLPRIFELAEMEQVDRLYFSHLVYSGRGARIVGEDLAPRENRAALDYLVRGTADFCSRGISIEVTTGNNDADGVYLYLKVKKEAPERAKSVYGLLRRRGGNSSGISLANIDSSGNVHPDPFWSHYSLGNIRERSFAAIWEDTSDPIMRVLKDRGNALKGRCGRCPYLEICRGNSRVRAEAATGDLWASDPACYLSDEELGIERLSVEDSHASIAV